MDEVMLTKDLNQSIYCSDILTSRNLIQLCQDACEHVIMVTDDKVGPLYGEPLLRYLASHHIKASCITISAGESSKSRQMKQFIEDKMLALACGRDTMMIALGGGVVTDLTGFVGATYCRGIPVIYIPTSLLAMVDASIGGKTGINTRYGKNSLGTFTEPKAILIDINYLQTLSKPDYQQAFSEIVKHALIADEDYFSFIESHITQIEKKELTCLKYIIKRSCEIKTMIVSHDQEEHSIREILNFGHTIAHALETLSQYAMNHGQAVAIGMMVEGYLSNQMGLLPDEHFHRIENILLKLNISMAFQMDFSKEDFLKALCMDKKSRKGQYRFVLLKRIGQVAHINNTYAQVVRPKLIEQAIDYMSNF